ncbi:hypothetical protein ENHAE0001_1627 [Enhydrobacter aerosaccus SK60]|nr:hypothetical protein ENHAE0001_1627 [Enhydrobacter aerosaccus SK60]
MKTASKASRFVSMHKKRTRFVTSHRSLSKLCEYSKKLARW